MFAWLVLSLVSQDYMKMLQPVQESPQDKEVLKLLTAIDQAVAAKKQTEAQALTEKLRATPNAAKSLGVLIKSSTPLTRALGAYGFRLLPVKGGFKEKLQYLLLDGEASVRTQVLLYVAQEPAGIQLQSIQLSLNDGQAQVRAAAVGAIVRTAKKPEEAAQLLRNRLQQEKDEMVIQKIKIGFTALGMSSQ